MFRVLLFVILCIAAILGIGWFKATSLPDWYDEQVIQGANDPVEQLTKIIQSQGIEAFFSNKLSDLLAGKLILNEDEFNALILSSLANDERGRELLTTSDIVRAQINENQLEIGAVVDMNKLKNQSASIKNRVDQLANILPALDQSKVYLAIAGQPVARNGELAFADDLAVKIGDLSIPNSLLAQADVSTRELQQQSLKITYLKINEINLNSNNIELAVRPSF